MKGQGHMGIKRDLGRLIQKLRKRLGVTQEEFGKRFDPVKSGASVSRWESGQHMPEPENMEAVLDLAASVDMVSEFMALRGEARLRDRLNEEEYLRRLRQASKGEVPDGSEEYAIGEHLVVLLPDGSLLVNERVRIDPPSGLQNARPVVERVQRVTDAEEGGTDERCDDTRIWRVYNSQRNRRCSVASLQQNPNLEALC